MGPGFIDMWVRTSWVLDTCRNRNRAAQPPVTSMAANAYNLTAAVPSVPCLPDQAAVLLRLKRSFAAAKNSTTIFLSWRAGTDCCRWDGVRCGQGSGRVTSLDLGGYLSLAYNDFGTSELPTTGFERLTELTHLNLATCNFTEMIPINIGRLTSFVSLDLSTTYVSYDLGSFGYVYTANTWDNSNLENMIPIMQNGAMRCYSQLPRSLAACKNLEVLDIGNNQISDYFPCWMSALARLQVLVLKSNRFLGQMDHHTTEVTKSCEFPKSLFTRLKSMAVKMANEAMEYTDISQVATIITYKGFELSISNIPGSLVFIYISNNAFYGSTPDAIGELVLLNMLNLSHNSYTGLIPSLLGRLKLLEALDEASPLFAGSSRIPKSTHFTTFTNSSFLGNDGLCGPPLSKECINTTTSSAVTHHSKKKFVDIVFFLFAGLGFGIGFAVTIVVTWGIPIRKRS
ncbi:hypothetical protein EJB05_31356, partial [Eragrostis curvula]